MNKVFMFTILAVISFLIQGSVVFPYKPFLPDLTLIVLVVSAIFNGPSSGALYGLLLGIGQDIVFGRPVGISSFTFFAIGYVAGILERKVFKDNPAVPAFMVFVASIANLLLMRVVLTISAVTKSIQPVNLNQVVVAAFINALFTLLLFVPLYKINRWTNRSKTYRIR